jgi:hypothetical protein
LRIYLPLKFKGNRNYLHGSDFFNEISFRAAELTGDVRSYIKRISFRQFADAACVITDEKPMDKKMLVGQVDFQLGEQGSTAEFWIIKTDEKVDTRYPYDENLVLSRATLDMQEHSGKIVDMSDYTLIEYVIALTKHLNYAVCPLVNGKWVFGQLDVEKPMPSGCQKLEIRMKNLIPARFSVNDIFADGEKVGVMRFIVGEA